MVKIVYWMSTAPGLFVEYRIRGIFRFGVPTKCVPLG